MNKSSFVGLILCGVAIYFGIVTSIPMSTLMNSHALILVLGGTVAISLFTYSADRLKGIFTFIVNGFLLKQKSNDLKMIEDLILAVKAYGDANGAKVELHKAHPFVVDSVRLLEEPDITVEDVAHILKSRKDAVRRKYYEDAKILQNIAKYPPQLGLIGAASGMVQMLIGLGNKGGMEAIGSAMAVALTATLWGIFLNNFVFLPLADNANKAAEDEMFFRDIVCESIIMLKEEVPQKVVTETVVSRLMSGDRIAIKNKILRLREQVGAVNALG